MLHRDLNSELALSRRERQNFGVWTTICRAWTTIVSTCLRPLAERVARPARRQPRQPHTLEASGLDMDVADLAAVLDYLQVEEASFFGCSMGERIGCE